MTKAFASGAAVSWAWGAHRAHGKVATVFRRRVQRTIKGERIVRNASDETPAYLVVQDDGGKALKSHTELSAG